MLGLAATATASEKDAGKARKERAKEARERAQELEAEIQRLEGEIKAHEKDVAKIREHIEKTDRWQRTELSNEYVVGEGGTVRMDPEAGRERVRRGKKLRSDLGAAQRQLKYAEKRAQEEEARAKPLSKPAARALQALADEVALRDEMAERGITLPALANAADRQRLLAIAADYGVQPGG